jgi:hypothetical protein
MYLVIFIFLGGEVVGETKSSSPELVTTRALLMYKTVNKTLVDP